MTTVAELKADAEAALKVKNAYPHHNYNMTANPATILKLIAVVEAAKAFIPKKGWVDPNGTVLRNALKELNDD